MHTNRHADLMGGVANIQMAHMMMVVMLMMTDDDDDDDEDDADADDGSSAVCPGLQDNADFAISFCFYCFKTTLSQFSKSKIFRWEVLV